ncbi:double zinc ribbon domain-containing protein [Qipengyuania sp. MTN3-11]|uniref:double zinc ribbon domain-containing protein n=1 Tax=Qipengyuania sp. MTN3-11 TaxID=3056557 RepID=UPI0036F3ECFA
MLSAIRRGAGEALVPLVDAIYPPRCPACGNAIGAQTGLCRDCWEDLVIPGEPACASCMRPMRSEWTASEAICAPCMASPPRHDGIAAATLYTATSRKLVLAFKHGRKLALAPLLARMIAAKLPTVDGAPLLVPVPLHRFRLWRRGFNQAALLARELERLGRGVLLVDALERRKRTPPLGGMGARARKRALAGAISTRPAATARIAGRHVILVDDVLTSGATSDTCVVVLKRAGAASVTLACFARVLDESLPTGQLSG